MNNKNNDPLTGLWAQNGMGMAGNLIAAWQQALLAPWADAMSGSSGGLSTAPPALPFFPPMGAAPRMPSDKFGLGEAALEASAQLAAEPAKVAEALQKSWSAYAEAASQLLSGRAGPPAGDRRYADAEWSRNPSYAALVALYHAFSEATEAMLAPLEGPEGEKLRFFARQMKDACAPTNNPAINPAVMRRALETEGKSLIDGLRAFAEDARAPSGFPAPRQTDDAPFELGRNIATSPGKVVYRNALIELIQYEPSTPTVHKRPLLIFPPWINKFYILDLREDNSMIRFLVGQGLTVFVVSWRSADAATADYEWDDYVVDGIGAALDAACEAADVKRIHTVGYCIGGTLLSGAMAYLQPRGCRRIKTATFFASQSDFELAGELKVLTDRHAINLVRDVIADHGGVMPGEVMRETFNWLRPNDLIWRYVVDNYFLGKNPKPFDLLYWNGDQTNIPGPTHVTYLDRLYRQNALAEGRFEILGERVDLGDVTVPVLVQASRSDHICPFESVYRTARAFGGRTRFVLAGSGHIAGVINPPTSGKYQHWVNDQLPETPEAWLTGAEERPGSWWPTWMDWLLPQSGRQVPARMPADRGLGDAPGRYVRVRLDDLAMTG